MIYISTNLLKPCMILARAIPSRGSSIPLVAVGEKLTASLIEKLKERGIQGVYIQNDLIDDLDQQEFIEPEFKNQLIQNIKKEFDFYTRKRSINVSINSFKAFSNMAGDLVERIMNKQDLLFNVLDIRDYDTYTYEHSIYVGTLSVVIGMNMGLLKTDLHNLALSGFLHDIGKLSIPLEITNKPGPLTDEEFEVMKQHPANSKQFLSPSFRCSTSVVSGILSHHERYDGNGYPAGLEGDKIPLYGRILALADVYDALSSNRPYRKAWQPEKIMEYMIGASGTQFDERIVPYFIESIVIYAIGTMVYLSDGSYGVVIANLKEYILKPDVKIVFPPERQGETLQLSAEENKVFIVRRATDEELQAFLESTCI